MTRGTGFMPAAAPSWASVTDKPSTFPPSAHTHAIGDVPGLQTALDAKSTVALGNTAGQASTVSGTVGDASTAARSNHTHPLPAGRMELIGTVTVSQTLLVGLALGMRRVDLALTGVTTSDKLVFAPLTPCAAGCEAVNVYPKAANQVTVAYYTPALLIGAVINIPIAVYRIV